MSKRTFNCLHCGTIIDTTVAARNCSNCFSCTDCERYICPQCGKEAVIKEVKKAQW